MADSAIGLGSGGSGGGGLVFRDPEDLFATIAARNTHFTTTASTDHLNFVSNRFLAVIVGTLAAPTFYTYVGDDQSYNAAMWVARSSAIQGPRGNLAPYYVQAYVNSATPLTAAPTTGSVVVSTGAVAPPTGGTVLPSAVSTGEDTYETIARINPLQQSGTVTPAWSVWYVIGNPAGALAAQVAAETAATNATAAQTAAAASASAAVGSQNAATASAATATTRASASGSSELAAAFAQAGALTAEQGAETAQAGAETAQANAEAAQTAAEVARNAAQSVGGHLAAVQEYINDGTQTGAVMELTDAGALNLEIRDNTPVGSSRQGWTSTRIITPSQANFPAGIWDIQDCSVSNGVVYTLATNGTAGRIMVLDAADALSNVALPTLASGHYAAISVHYQVSSVGTRAVIASVDSAGAWKLTTHAMDDGRLLASIGAFSDQPVRVLTDVATSYTMVDVREQADGSFLLRTLGLNTNIHTASYNAGSSPMADLVNPVSGTIRGNRLLVLESSGQVRAYATAGFGRAVADDEFYFGSGLTGFATHSTQREYLSTNEALYQFEFVPLVGADGATLFLGQDPVADDGEDGDAAVNTAAGSFWKKESGAWVKKYTVPAAAAGTIDGTTLFLGQDPVSADGVNGDTAVNTAAGSFWKKAANAWTKHYTVPAAAAGTTDGTVLFLGQDPVSTDGVNGDAAVNTAAGSFWKKASGTWDKHYTVAATAAGASDGTTLFLARDPVVGDGANGDAAVNTVAGSFWKRASDTWTKQYTVPAALAGSVDGTVIFSAADPTSGDGVNGDTSLNTVTGTLWKKASDAWVKQYTIETIIHGAYPVPSSEYADRVWIDHITDQMFVCRNRPDPPPTFYGLFADAGLSDIAVYKYISDAPVPTTNTQLAYTYGDNFFWHGTQEAIGGSAVWHWIIEQRATALAAATTANYNAVWLGQYAWDGTALLHIPTRVLPAATDWFFYDTRLHSIRKFERNSYIGNGPAPDHWYWESVTADPEHPDVIDVRDGNLPPISNTGSDDRLVAIGTDGLYTVYLKPESTGAATVASWASYAYTDSQTIAYRYLGVYENDPFVPGTTSDQGKFYYNKRHHKFRVVLPTGVASAGFFSDHWEDLVVGQRGYPANFIGHYDTRADAIAIAAHHGIGTTVGAAFTAYTGSLVEVATGYVEPTAIQFSRHWKFWDFETIGLPEHIRTRDDADSLLTGGASTTGVPIATEITLSENLAAGYIYEILVYNITDTDKSASVVYVMSDRIMALAAQSTAPVRNDIVARLCFKIHRTGDVLFGHDTLYIWRSNDADKIWLAPGRPTPGASMQVEIYRYPLHGANVDASASAASSSGQASPGDAGSGASYRITRVLHRWTLTGVPAAPTAVWSDTGWTEDIAPWLESEPTPVPSGTHYLAIIYAYVDNGAWVSAGWTVFSVGSGFNEEEYSQDATNWHTNRAFPDTWMRVRKGDGSWSTPILIGIINQLDWETVMDWKVIYKIDTGNRFFDFPVAANLLGYTELKVEASFLYFVNNNPQIFQSISEDIIPARGAAPDYALGTFTPVGTMRWQTVPAHFTNAIWQHTAEASENMRRAAYQLKVHRDTGVSCILGEDARNAEGDVGYRQATLHFVLKSAGTLETEFGSTIDAIMFYTPINVVQYNRLYVRISGR